MPILIAVRCEMAKRPTVIDTTCQAYRGYLIRWSAFTIVTEDARYWVEKDNAFIGWATSEDDAKAIINILVE